MTIGNAQLKTILLVDDDKDDREFFQEALDAISSNVVLRTAENGFEALRKLRLDNELPELIFLDLNMPLKNGYECLDEAKADEKLKHIPVVIFSTSLQSETADQVYESGASLYVVKPNSFPGLKSLLQKFDELDWQIPLNTLKENFIFKA
jgi:CheY-like chemotaxis protein